MAAADTYTMSQLAELSDFDARTIAFYVQKELLPKVGRRGPKTRYSQEFLERLLFIRRVRDLQDSGRLRAVTLSEIRDVIEGLSAAEIRRASQEDVTDETLRGFFAVPDLDTSDLEVAAEDVALSAMREGPDFGSALADVAPLRRSLESSATSRGAAMSRRRVREQNPVGNSSAEDTSNESSSTELSRVLQEVELRARIAGKGRGLLTRERVTRVPVTEEIVLSVRDIDDRDAHLVDKLAALLRRIGRLDRDRR